ncbi:MAG: LA_2272 family surface repeat-containing protein [Endomicrobiales bacterium]
MKVIARLGLAAALLTFVVAGVFAAETTPVKVSLFPKLGLPEAQVVHGLDLGLIATNVEEVQGLQASWIFGGVDQKMVGLQLGFVAKANVVTGVQYGFYNGANEVTGVQLGFINVTETMKGVQVGLVNVIKKGLVPAMVIVNASF